MQIKNIDLYLNSPLYKEFLGHFKNRLDLLIPIAKSVSHSEDIEKYEYWSDGHMWTVFDGKTFKLTVNDDHSYHCFFDKTSGLNIRFGETLGDDPEYCGLGPEILDLEVSVNGCVPVPGSTNCRYCYKNNTNAPATNMSFETFKAIVDRFPKNLSQIAFGITGLQTNPDLERMFKYCRKIGIVPNVTTVGADMNDKMLDVLAENCGAVAVSCYTGAKALCYETIAKIHQRAKDKFNKNLHVNMHIVLSKDNLSHVKEVLQDIADKKVPDLNAVVFLRIKPKGRASKMDCQVPKEIYSDILSFCFEKDIPFGFDSCSATPVIEVLKDFEKENLCDNCEPCESSKFSSYINVKGEYWSCSFTEGLYDFIKPINVLDYGPVTEWWNSDEIKKVRNCQNPACKSCPVFNLD